MPAEHNINRLMPRLRKKLEQTLAEETAFCLPSETKEDVDAFYSPGNRIVASFLERARRKEATAMKSGLCCGGPPSRIY